MDQPGQPVPRLAALLASYAGRDAGWHWLLWAYDARLADIVQTTREPLVGQMRLTWWHEVLSDESGVKGRGDPLVDALRSDAGMGAARGHLLAMIDGWEVLLDPLPLDEEALRLFAKGRGGGLFAALGASMHSRAGPLWALWDLSGHIGDPVTAERAVTVAQSYLPVGRESSTPLRLAAGLARYNIVRGKSGPKEITPRLYARLLRLAVLGR